MLYDLKCGIAQVAMLVINESPFTNKSLIYLWRSLWQIELVETNSKWTLMKNCLCVVVLNKKKKKDA
jgi:hypothetical protein